MPITEGDRSRLYDTIGRELDSVLSGPQAYFPDGVQKDPREIAHNLMGLVTQLKNLRDNYVVDPSNVLGPMVDALEEHAKDFKSFFEEPADPSKLPPEKSPTSRDNGVIYVDPDPDLYSLPNPLSPKQRPQFYRASIQPEGNNGLSQPEPSSQADRPLGIYSGKPMRQWIVPPPIWRGR